MTANPNTLLFQSTWDKVYQYVWWKRPVYRAFADEKLASSLKKGQIIYRTYITPGYVSDMGGDGAYSRQALVDAQEYLQVNKEKEYSFYIKELDEIQTHLPTRAKYAQDAMNQIFLKIDGDVLSAPVTTAGSTVDDADLAGTSGNGITVGTTNIDDVFVAAMRKLMSQNVIVDQQARFSGDVKLDNAKAMPVAAISPRMYASLVTRIASKTTILGDNTSTNGHVGMYMGFNVFVTNNLTWTGDLVLDTNPSDTNTLVLTLPTNSGVGPSTTAITFTFRATLGSSAGSLHICSDAANTCTNLVNALNAIGTSIGEDTNTGYVAVSSANQKILGNISAIQIETSGFTASASGTGVRVTVSGIDYVAVTDTLVSATDGFVAARQLQHAIFGTNNSISLVIQKTPSLVIKDRTGYIGYDFVTWTAYGYKVFADQAKQLVNIKVRTDAFVA